MKTNAETPIAPRILAPKQDRTAVVEPSLVCSAAVVAENQKLVADATFQVCGTPFAEFRRHAREEFLRAAAEYVARYADVKTDWRDATSKPLYLTGHQPQLFHPGVWFKNFACDAAAKRDGAVGVNVVMDGDVTPAPAIRVPGGSAEEPIAESVPFDRAEPPVAFEERQVSDEETFRSFDRRAASVLRPFVSTPFLNEYWPTVLKRLGENRSFGGAFAQARHQFELAQGLRTLELPQSRMCGLPSFRRFVGHLLGDLRRFADIYNRSVQAYRAAHRIRSDAHPVPLLQTDGDWIEAPFWIWNSQSPRRRRLFVKFGKSDCELSDRGELRLTVPWPAKSGCDDFAEALERWESQGVKIRSKALISTLWMRLFLSDLFIHGIGGANYDQVTDQIIRDFFGCDAPRFMVVSATLHLPTAGKPFDEFEVQNVKQALRDVEFHPERFYLAPYFTDGEAPENVWRLIEEKARWLSTNADGPLAKARHQGIAAANVAIAATLSDRRLALQRELAEAMRRRRANGVLTWREYAFCLYPVETITNFFTALVRS